MPKQPQDHQPAKGQPFRFRDAGGKSHTLPSATIGRKALTGRDLRDAALGGDAGMLGFMFKALEASGPTKAALDAFYSLPHDEATDVLEKWANHSSDGDASLGESSSSSD